MSRPLRVLFLVHGHPADRPGGAEQYAWEVYHAMRADRRFAPVIVTRVEPATGRPVLAADPADPHHFRLATDEGDYDPLFHDLRTRGAVGWWLDKLTREFAPDVVHVQHTRFVGLSVLERFKRAAPGARLVHTLHEYQALCHHGGLLYRTHDPGPCDGPTPDRCHGCFPTVSPASFRFRNWYAQKSLTAVDLFLCPSRFLAGRYAEWGVPADKLVVEEYGRLPSAPVPPRAAGRRDRFGYFGQINPRKGADVLLAAALRLATPDAPPFHVHVSGANLHIQSPDWIAGFERLRAEAVATGRVTDHGPYDRTTLAERMRLVDWVVVPSVWWENSPLVIQEAFAAGRPVLAADIGGTAEKVTDGVNGLHFRAADPLALARTMRQAADTPGLWDRLQANVRPPYPMSAHLDRLYAIYAGGR